MSGKVILGVAGISNGMARLAKGGLAAMPASAPVEEAKRAPVGGVVAVERITTAQAAAANSTAPASGTATPTASIIPSPGTPPEVVNVTTSANVDNGTVTIAAGSELYATAVNTLYSTSYTASLVNNGVIWNAPASGPGGIVAGFYTVDNAGKMVVRTQGFAGAVAVTIGATGTLTNTGSIFAIAADNAAQVVKSFYPVHIINSGLLAASSTGEQATGVNLYNSGQLVNAIGGRVLAEGAGAIGVHVKGDLGSEVQVKNAGLIEAKSLDAGILSVGVYLMGAGSDNHFIVENSGTIRGDWAILGDSVTGTSTPQRHSETIKNLAGGAIEGDISLDRGNDAIVNAGMIRGQIYMGEGADSIDTNAGTIDGIADLGWGNDSYIGGAGVDRVAGDDGNDVITGNGGNDLLMGGGNDDVITGGLGNDGLFGEYGNDRIITLEGDYVSGGAGKDRIEAGDYKFSLIDGGSGFDTLVLPGTARIFDLSAALAEEAIFDIEAIELGGSREIVVRAADIPAITEGAHKLRIAGVASDKVDLVGSWSASGTTVIDGVSYRQFVSGAETILVSGAAVVTVMATAPAGAIGLDPVSGTAPPFPGDDSGLDFTPLEFYLDGYDMTEDITVNEEELFYNDGYYVFLAYNSGLTLTNHGAIASYTDWNLAYGAFAIYAANLKLLVNTGTIAGIWDYDRGVGEGQFEETRGFTYGLAQGQRVENTGLIYAETFHGIALGATQVDRLINDGEISAYSTYGFATAVDEPDIFDNHGDVLAEGGWSAIGVRMRYSNLTNDGSIVAKTTGIGAHESIGVQFNLAMAGSFTNDGAIVADIAFQLEGPGLYGFALTNTGMMTGRIELGQSDDSVVNSGVIYGDVKLGTGNDVFDGTTGQQNGTVDGGAGNDRLTGGAGDDRLTGGAGVDTLKGLGGNDVLTAGDGGPQDSHIALGSDVPRGTRDTAFAVSLFTLVGDPRFTDVPNMPRAVVDLKGTGQTDWLRFTVEKAGNTTIYIDQLTFDPSMVLVDAQGNVIHPASAGGSSSNGIHVESFDLTPGTYFLQFYQYTSDIVPANSAYRMTFLVPGQSVVAVADTGSILDGGSGDDVLFGGASHDTLIGGTGLDRMTGGAGNDIYDVDQQGDLVFEDAGGGADTVTAHAGFYLYANVENLTLAGDAGDIFGVGNELANTMLGNEGSNLLIAGAGDDVVRGGAGVDSLFGQDGTDQLFGDAGIDYLVGGIGNDMLDGGLDADALYGEDGDDTLIGGSDFKTDILVGGAGNDVLRGDSGLADYDLMDGGAGNDSYYVDTGDDLTFEGVNGGIDTVYANVAGANNGVYLYANVENLVLLNTTTFGVGNELANTMTGSASANWLLGGAGNDTLNGKGGNDVLFGEGGADTFVFERGTGGDVIGDFVAGTDKIDLTAFGFASFQAVVNSMREVNGTTAIDLGNGDMIVLNGVANAALHAGDFVLAAAKIAPASALDSDFGLTLRSDAGALPWEGAFGMAPEVIFEDADLNPWQLQHGWSVSADHGALL